MKKMDAWKVTFLLLFIYFGFGIYLINMGVAHQMEGFFAGAAMWFVLGGVILLFIELFMWEEVE